MVDFVVKTQFKAIDRITPDLKKMGITVVKTGRRMDKSFKRASKSAGVFRGVLKGIVVAGVIRRGAMLASTAIRGLGDEFIEFDRNITKAVTRLPGGLDRTSDAFKQLGGIARVEAKRTEFTAGEAALAVEQLALAGFDLAKITATLPGVLNLATNADVELAQAATIATKTLGAFGLKVDDVAQQQTNLTRVNDVFSSTVSSASIDMENLFEVMKFGGPAAFAAGQSIETFAATAGVLADSTIDASVAGTSLRKMFITLAKPTPKAAKLIRKLGIEISDSKGNFKDFFDIMDDVSKGTRKMGDAQKLAALTTLFGVRSVNAANVILNKGSKELRAYRKQLEESGGASKKMAKTIRTSIEGRLKRLKSALVETGFKFIEAFNDNAGESIEAAIRAVSRFDVGPVIKDLKDMIRETKDLVNAVKPFFPLFKIAAVGFVIYKAAMTAIIALAAPAVFLALAKAVQAATGAQGLLNVAMLLNPIGIVTIAVVGLSAALAILITDFDSVSLGWEAMFTHIGIAFTEFKIKLLSGIRDIIDAFLDVVPFLSGGLIDPIDTSDLGVIDKSILFEKISLKDQKRRLLDVQEQATFGDKGVRRHDFPSQRNLPKVPKPPTPARVKELDILNLLKVTGGAAANAIGGGKDFAPQAPNRSQIEAQQVLMEANLNVAFANAPAGMSVETKTGRGSPKVNTKGLGDQ